MHKFMSAKNLKVYLAGPRFAEKKIIIVASVVLLATSCSKQPVSVITYPAPTPTAVAKPNPAPTSTATKL